jgi:hypothetical protein
VPLTWNLSCGFNAAREFFGAVFGAVKGLRTRLLRFYYVPVFLLAGRGAKLIPEFRLAG